MCNMNQAQILETIFNTTHLCIAYLDEEFNFIRVNHAYANGAGHPESYFTGKNHFDLYPHTENEAIFKSVVAKGEPYTIFAKPFEFPDHPEWGVTYWDWSLYPVKSQKGSVNALIFTLLDVTPAKKTEFELLEIKRSLEKQVEIRTADLLSFSYSISHDLRVPLRAITGFSKILLDEYASSLDNECQKFLKIISDSCIDMDKLITDLLDYTRLSGRSVNLKRVQISSIIPHLLMIMEKGISDTNANVKIVKPLGEVSADPVMLQQIMINMIENALIYSKNGSFPVITISSELKDDSVILKVEDEGIGIETENLEAIFHPFQRLHSGSKYEGTGIGLANVKKMATMMGGQVWAESVFGKGTTFFIKLNSPDTSDRSGR